MSTISIRDKRIELMRFYSNSGKSIVDTCRLIGIKPRTAKEYAKMFSIPFHDYKPRQKYD